jgi:hypothetical protein
MVRQVGRWASRQAGIDKQQTNRTVAEECVLALGSYPVVSCVDKHH